MHIDDLLNVYRNVCLSKTFLLINYKGESCFGFLFKFVNNFVLLLLLYRCNLLHYLFCTFFQVYQFLNK